MSEKYQYLKKEPWKACQTGTTPIIKKERVGLTLYCLDKIIIATICIIGLIALIGQL